MPTLTPMPARGKITATEGNRVVFQPAETSYELHLASTPVASIPLNTPVAGLVRCIARSVWTVPSGGCFITPILGEPRTIQGRVRLLNDREMIVDAGTPVLVVLPESDMALDLAHGPIAVGALVNIVAMPGTTFQILEHPDKYSCHD